MAVVVEVAGCDAGEPRGELAVEQQQRPGGPHVQRHGGVVEAAAEQLPACVFAGEVSGLGIRDDRRADAGGRAGAVAHSVKARMR